MQRAKKVVPYSPGLVMLFEEFEQQKNCEINSACQKAFGLVEMSSGLVNASFSLPEWQACKNDFLCTLLCLLVKYVLI